jgi:DNA-binding GntR family transcriptional regulator
MIAITRQEQTAKVLQWLLDNHESDEYDEGSFFHFAPIIRDTGLSRADVRRACRLLKRQGKAEFSRALCDHDGNFRGFRISRQKGDMNAK